MIGAELLGSNIRNLRRYYHETQEELGSFLNCTRQTISSYEHGDSYPNDYVLSALSDHFMVSEIELTSCVYEDIMCEKIDEKDIFKHLIIFFPIMKDAKSLKNGSFKRAYAYHEALFDELSKVDFRRISNLGYCLDGYERAMYDERSHLAAVADHTGLTLFSSFIVNTIPEVLKRKAVTVTNYMSPAEIFELDDPESTVDSYKSRKVIDDLKSHIKRDLLERNLAMLTEDGCSMASLGLFYVAASYLWDIPDNGVEWQVNRLCGEELMCRCAKLDNPYAKSFMNLIESLTSSKKVGA